MAKGDKSTDRFLRKNQEKEWAQSGMPDDDLPPPEPKEPLKTGEATGRNDPCPCGSGKKYKQCCMKKK